MKKSEKLTVRVLFPVKQSIETSIINFISSHPKVNWFQLQSVTGYSPFKNHYCPLLFVATLGKDVVGAVIAFHIQTQALRILNPYTSWIQANGSPLITITHPETKRILSVLLEKISNYSKKRAILLEFRNSYDTLLENKLWLKQDFSFTDHLNLIKTISTQDKLWEELGENRRRQILKATKNGTKVRPAENEYQVRSFYYILKKLYQKKVKKVLPSLDFFQDFFIQSQNEGKGLILLAFKEEKVIGGIVCPIHEGNTMYEWYVCGLDQEYPLNHPSVMVTWHALLYAYENGIRIFDFMGLGKPNIPYGVRDFKLRFGGEVINFGRYTKVHRPLVLKAATIIFKILIRFI